MANDESHGSLASATREALLKAIKDEVEGRTTTGGLLELAEAYQKVMEVRVPGNDGPMNIPST